MSTSLSDKVIALRLAKANQRLQAAVNALNKEYDKLSMEWEFSPQREHLILTIKNTILAQKSIKLDSALCLGLGPIDAGRRDSLPGGNPWIPLSSCFTRNDEGQEFEPDEGFPVSFRPIGKGRRRNATLYQLLVFETVLRYLRMTSVPQQFILGTY